jgi:signal transduction histidine kinase
MITVSARRDGSGIDVAVTDDGVGLNDRPGSTPGLGLSNTRERLATFYSGRASLELAPASPSGTIAAISSPVTDG